MTEPAALSLDEEKDRLRVRAKAKRVAAAQASPRAAEGVARQLLQNMPLPRGAVVSGFWPLEGEIDLRPVLQELHQRGFVLALPVLQGAGKPLLFRRWEPGDTLQAAAFGTREPGPDKPLLTPQVLLVPLLAFDRAGYRLGYGGGFYDRSLAELGGERRVTSIGIAFAGQEVERVPHDERDQRLQWIVTESGVIDSR